MSLITSPDEHLLVERRYRVCLPYGIDLLRLTNWLDRALARDDEPKFDIVVGERHHLWSGSDAIELFNQIRGNCLNYSLANSYIVCNNPNSLWFLDIYERFSFFSAEFDVLKALYPYSREIMWENFALLQEKDDDVSLAEIFESIQSV